MEPGELAGFRGAVSVRQLDRVGNPSGAFEVTPVRGFKECFVCGEQLAA
ncbi:hypothetical protein ACFQ36_18325 [Arthrobacter sp. GCM10027362]